MRGPSLRALGPPPRGLAEEVAERGVERLPRDLWHAVLFYSTGRTVQALLAERGTPGYEPYVYREGLFERAWPELRRPLEEHGQPYLEGRIGMEEEARRLVEAVREE